jgi:hypothetical protein
MGGINIMQEKTKSVKRGFHNLDGKKLLRKARHSRKAHISDSSSSPSFRINFILQHCEWKRKEVGIK